MRVTPEELASRYPVLYHMAEGGSLENIQKLGLLSTSALLERFEVNGDRRFGIESARWPEIVVLEHTEHGRALVQDNKPMHESVLERCLAGMTPREWYETLNRRVFFWVERKRLVRLLGAKAYRDRPHLVLELETAESLRRHEEKVSVSPINSGATFTMNRTPRGPNTFRRIGDHPRGKAVVEVTVDYGVPDARELVLSASRWHSAEMLGEVQSRSG